MGEKRAQMHQLIAHDDAKQGNKNVAVAQFRKVIAIDPRYLVSILNSRNCCTRPIQLC